MCRCTKLGPCSTGLLLQLGSVAACFEANAGSRQAAGPFSTWVLKVVFVSVQGSLVCIEVALFSWGPQWIFKNFQICLLQDESEINPLKYQVRASN